MDERRLAKTFADKIANVAFSPAKFAHEMSRQHPNVQKVFFAIASEFLIKSANDFHEGQWDGGAMEYIGREASRIIHGED